MIKLQNFREKKINYFRGDLHDVWSRFVKILKLNNETFHKNLQIVHLYITNY